MLVRHADWQLDGKYNSQFINVFCQRCAVDFASGWLRWLCRQGEEASFEPGTLTGELLILATAANQLFQSTQDMSPDAQVGLPPLFTSSPGYGAVNFSHSQGMMSRTCGASHRHGILRMAVKFGHEGGAALSVSAAGCT
jgi:hypothetical protein